MGTYHDAVQRTVVFRIAVIGALADSALDAFVCVAVHADLPPLLESRTVCHVLRFLRQEKLSVI